MSAEVLIAVKDLEKTYGDGTVQTPALCGVSFSIQKGEFVAVMGPSGSGKSTLFHILGFLDRHTSGEYRFDGKIFDDYTEEEMAEVRNQKMGFIFQSFNLLPRATVFENVALPLLYSGVRESLWRQKTLAAVEAVGLSHRLGHVSNQLSGGEKQRVAIARALVNDPQVILADEPTGNLDSKSGESVMNILECLNQKDGRTVVLITHETYTAGYAGRIIRLRDGRVESDEKNDLRHGSDGEFKK